MPRDPNDEALWREFRALYPNHGESEFEAAIRATAEAEREGVRYAGKGEWFADLHERLSEVGGPFVGGPLDAEEAHRTGGISGGHGGRSTPRRSRPTDSTFGQKDDFVAELTEVQRKLGLY